MSPSSSFGSTNAVVSGGPPANPVDPSTLSTSSGSPAYVNPNAKAQTEGPGAGGINNGQPITSQTSQPTVLSSANVTENTIPNTISSVQNYPQSGSITDNTGVTRYADGSFAEAPSGASQNQDGTWSYNGQTYALGPLNGAISSNPSTQALYDQLTSMKSTMDAQGVAQIQSIQSTYDQLINKQEQVNAGAEAKLNTLLMKGGSYNNSSGSGILAAQTSFDLQNVATLQAKEQAAITAAQTAMQNGDYKVMTEQYNIAKQAKTDMQTAAQKIFDNLNTNLKTVQADRYQAAKDNAVATAIQQGISNPQDILSYVQSQGMTNITAKDIAATLSNLSPSGKQITTMLETAAKNGAPSDVLQKIGSSTSIEDATIAAGDWLNASSNFSVTTGQGGQRLIVDKRTGKTISDLGASTRTPAGKSSSTAAVGSALAAADAAIQAGADPEAVRKRFLTHYPTSNAAWTSYFGKSSSITSLFGGPSTSTPSQ